MKNKSLLTIMAVLIIALNSVAQETGTFTDSRDGKTYKTVVIGTQTWMAENLAYKESSGCWAYENSQDNVKTYGYLYNWETAKKVCPSGWHLPSDSEWTTMTDFLGGMDNAGGKLKSITGWDKPNKRASNKSGFTALPGGTRGSYGKFSSLGSYGGWWSSTEENDEVWSRHMTYIDRSVSKSIDQKNSGFSVRCVKDK